MAGQKVLLVDDEVEFTKTLSERMEARGIHAHTAANGAEALEKLDAEKFDAIILDMQMPGMDGIETLRRMLEKNPDLQIILLTGYATVGKSVEAMKIGAKDFLEKPANIEELVEKIKLAGNERIALVEKRAEESIRDILKGKSW